jgi:hypothetical protein
MNRHPDIAASPVAPNLEPPTVAPTPGTPEAGDLRHVPVSWQALEDAFENNAPEVHSYLHLETGEVIRIIDGIADPGMHQRVMKDAEYLRVDPVSSREQYRWMERFIATVDEPGLRDALIRAVDGKGAFRRFKDALMTHPVERERWFSFRSERLRSCMEGWLGAHGIAPMERTEWKVPTAEEVRPQVEREDERRQGRRTRAAVVEQQRLRLAELVDELPARELDAALAFLEFLRERKRAPRPHAFAAGPAVTTPETDADAADPDGAEHDEGAALEHADGRHSAC